MRLAPPSIIRDEAPPDEMLLVVRGGRNSLSDPNLERATTDTWERYRFFGFSVFGAPGDDLVALSGREQALRRRPEVRLARVGPLRSGGFEVVATFTNPAHYSVVLPEASGVAFEALRACFGSSAQPRLRDRPVTIYARDVPMYESPIELWVDDHQEYEPGVVHAHLRHARLPIAPRVGDFLVVGDDDAPAVLAEVVGRDADGDLRLRLLPGRPDSHPEFATRRQPTAV